MAGYRCVEATLALLLLGACAEPRGGSGFGAAVRVCDDQGCRVQPTATVAGAPEDDRWRQRQQDPDLYRGEPVAPLREAAAAGDAGAAHRLGQAYEAGAGGLPRSAAQAARYYEVAAAGGLPFASYRLARLVEQGVVPGGRARALQLNTAAAQGGVAQAAHDLGVMALNRRDFAEAFRWFSQAAAGGVPESQYNLALLYFRGEGTPRQAYEAVRWMRRAGENGVLPAQAALGRMYLTGLEEQGQDLQEAQSWLSQAAARGDAESRRLLPGVTRAAQAERDAYQAFQRQYALQAAATRGYWGSLLLWSAYASPSGVFVQGW